MQERRGAGCLVAVVLVVFCVVSSMALCADVTTRMQGDFTAAEVCRGYGTETSALSWGDALTCRTP